MPTRRLALDSASPGGIDGSVLDGLCDELRRGAADAAQAVGNGERMAANLAREATLLRRAIAGEHPSPRTWASAVEALAALRRLDEARPWNPILADGWTYEDLRERLHECEVTVRRLRRRIPALRGQHRTFVARLATVASVHDERRARTSRRSGARARGAGRPAGRRRRTSTSRDDGDAGPGEPHAAPLRRAAA